MRRNKKFGMRIGVCFITLCALLLCSCRYHTEPEQIYPVSAMGFDCAEEGIRVTVEIAAAEGGEHSRTEAVCFSQTGESVEQALKSMADGLPRAMIFSHCALAVLGDGLTKEQMQEIFAFAGVENGLPLAAELVVGANAEALLRSERLSLAAAGYEIPEILERERSRRGAELPCQLYRLRAVFSPDLPISLPRFEVTEHSAVRFVGVDILRPYADPYRLTAEECTAHAILTNTYTGGSGNEIRWKLIRERIRVPAANAITLHLRLRMTGETEREAARLAEELKQRAERLYQRVTTETGEDLFLLEQRLKRQGAHWNAQAVLTVECEVK